MDVVVLDHHVWVQTNEIKADRIQCVLSYESGETVKSRMEDRECSVSSWLGLKSLSLDYAIGTVQHST
jgi:hypothetical protein